jgi:hypothetical protein
MQDWFECLRSRQQTHATVREGYGHSVACIIAAQSDWEGRCFHYDAKAILDRPPV